VASLSHLIAMKVLSRDDQRRPQDRLDLAALLSVATEAQLDLARQATQTIVDRGYSRGRQLVAELADIILEFKSRPKETDDL